MSAESGFKTKTPDQPWNRPWPQDELERIGGCPICASAERTALYNDLIDNVFYCAPGIWTLLRCSGCGTAYLDPCPTPNSINLAYENYYTHSGWGQKPSFATLSPLRKLRRILVNGYTNWRFSTDEQPSSRIGVVVFSLMWPWRMVLDREYRHLPRRASEDAALLDLGCGNGFFLRLAESAGWDATGLDFDERAVESCRRQGLDVRLGGIEQLEGRAGLFDVITMSHVVEHVHDPVSVLSACHRLLRPGGRLWLETPNIDARGHELYGRDWRGLEPPRHLTLFSRGSLLRALRAAGFVRIEVEKSPNPLLGISMLSEAIRDGRPQDHCVPLSGARKWRAMLEAFYASAFSGRSEFLTMTAHREPALRPESPATEARK